MKVGSENISQVKLARNNEKKRIFFIKKNPRKKLPKQ